MTRLIPSEYTENKKRFNGNTNRVGSMPTVESFIKRLQGKGTAGIYTKMAHLFNVSPATIKRWVVTYDDDRIDDAVCMEKSIMLDSAEDSMMYLMSQRLDLNAVFKAAKFILTHQAKERGYSDTKTHVIEGGDKPIQMESTVSLEQLQNVPLKVRERLLKALSANAVGESLETLTE